MSDVEILTREYGDGLICVIYVEDFIRWQQSLRTCQKVQRRSSNLTVELSHRGQEPYFLFSVGLDDLFFVAIYNTPQQDCISLLS